MLGTVSQVFGILDDLKIPSAQFMWDSDDEKPSLPYVILVAQQSNNLHTDGSVAFEAQRYDLELYSKTRDIPLEKRVKAALRQARIDYDTDYAVDEKGQVVITYFHVTLIEQEANNGN